MKRRIHTISLCALILIFSVTSCQKAEYLTGVNEKIEKADPFVQINSIMDTEIVIGTVKLDNNGIVKLGWLIDKKGELYRINVKEEIAFSIKNTPNSDYMVQKLLDNSTPKDKVDGLELLLTSRKIFEMGHSIPKYLDGDGSEESRVYFTFVRVSGFTSSSGTVTQGCESAFGASSAEENSSISTLIIHAEGKTRTIQSSENAQLIVDYLDAIIAEQQS